MTARYALTGPVPGTVATLAVIGGALVVWARWTRFERAMRDVAGEE